MLHFEMSLEVFSRKCTPLNVRNGYVKKKIISPPTNLQLSLTIYVIPEIWKIQTFTRKIMLLTKFLWK